jgi:hypothetical protein
MKIEFEKTQHIASELLSYCHLKGASEFHLDVSVVEHQATEFVITASPAHLSVDELALLKKRLAIPRQPEMEQDFWGLSGESESHSEICLVGMMVDEAQVEYNSPILKIILKRVL